MILFDLDGTLSDPLEGIARSINYALQHYGYELLDQEQIKKYIGPPIDQAFAHITGVNSAYELKIFVAKYRERYGDVGYSENKLYPGVSEALNTLCASGAMMGICTSKRRDFAEKIIELFRLRDYFLFIDGGEVGVEKWSQIERLISSSQINQNAVMVGDRAVDIIAAQKNGLEGCGVLWGYGSHEELLNQKPKYLFSSPVEWETLWLNMTFQGSRKAES